MQSRELRPLAQIIRFTWTSPISKATPSTSRSSRSSSSSFTGHRRRASRRIRSSFAKRIGGTRSPFSAHPKREEHCSSVRAIDTIKRHYCHHYRPMRYRRGREVATCVKLTWNLSRTLLRRRVEKSRLAQSRYPRRALRKRTKVPRDNDRRIVLTIVTGAWRRPRVIRKRHLAKLGNTRALLHTTAREVC